MYFNYRPEPTQTRKKFTNTYWIQISRIRRTQIRKNWTKSNPKTQTSRPKCMNEHSGTHLGTSQFFRVLEFLSSWVGFESVLPDTDMFGSNLYEPENNQITNVSETCLSCL